MKNKGGKSAKFKKKRGFCIKCEEEMFQLIDFKIPTYSCLNSICERDGLMTRLTLVKDEKK